MHHHQAWLICPLNSIDYALLMREQLGRHLRDFGQLGGEGFEAMVVHHLVVYRNTDEIAGIRNMKEQLTVVLIVLIPSQGNVSMENTPSTNGTVSTSNKRFDPTDGTAKNIPKTPRVKAVKVEAPVLATKDMLIQQLTLTVLEMTSLYRPVAEAHAAAMAIRVKSGALVDTSIDEAKIKMAAGIAALPLPTTVDEMEQRMFLLEKLSVTTRISRVVTTNAVKTTTSEKEDRLR